MIVLKEIIRDNFDDVIKLSVFDEQKHFVASNMYSLAQAKAMPECVPMAVYNDDDLVGFIMHGIDVDDNEYWISRIMIDKEKQGKGYGLAAMQCVLNELRTHKKHHRVYISFEPENIVAKKLYEHLGFVPDGRFIDGEMVYCLEFCQ